MNGKTKLGLKVLEAGLLLGVLGDALLRATPWGLNLTLWSGALAFAMLALLLLHGRNVALASDGRWLLLPLAFFSVAFAWRDSLTLKTLDALALLAVFSLIALRARGGWIRLAGVTEHALGGFLAGFNALFGSFALLFADIKWKELPREGWSRHVLAIVRGLAITIPLLLIFGALLMAADAVFEGLINKTLQLDFDNIFSHGLLLTFLAWLTAGFLRSALLGREIARTKEGRLDIAALSRVFTAPPQFAQVGLKTASGADAQATSGTQLKTTSAESSAPTQNSASAQRSAPAQSDAPARLKMRLSLGIVEIGIALGTLNLLFLSFVGVQVRYFFGGARMVQVSSALTYAEYARRGFFELVWVTALVLPILLAAHWLLRKENPSHERVFRLLAGMQVALLFVIMASAIGRMRLYQSEYGLTELRLYTTAFMGWLALVFVWFAATVLRGQRERFARGALVAAFLMMAALHVMNPDAFIVRINVAQAQAGRAFDEDYVAALSTDAVPALVEALPAVNDYERCAIEKSLFWKLQELKAADWRTWNWSRSEAASLLEERAAALMAGCGSGDDMLHSNQSLNAFRH
ncbi:MAG: hypothetical protein QOF02_1797 [Blastocatellia bacterium]|jgi:hypothetical protein|nr:hypothetical protein [Blastocatellia bacterium]